MRILGINAVFHDPAAALVVDGHIVAAAEEERFSRRKHGKEAVAFSTWELPVQSARWCLEVAGLSPSDLDAVGYSYDPRLMQGQDTDLPGLDRDWEYLRTLYAERAPRFLQSALPGLDPGIVRYVRHHVAHAASSALASPHPDCAVLVVDGRGERTSMLAGVYTDNKLDILAAQELPHSLGLLYEDLTQHLGFKRSSDEYKVMAMASYGRPRFIDEFRELVYTTGDGGFRTEPVDWSRFGTDWDDRVDLACSVQRVVEEVLLDLVRWLRTRTDRENLCLAGGVALNCVANSKLHNSGGFRSVWVQPAAGDSGTALGAALSLAAEAGEPITPMPTAALGRGFSDDEIEAALSEAAVPFERPDDPPPPWVTRWPTTASSDGSRAGPNSARGHWGGGHCWPIRVVPTTSTGSTRSRDVSSSARSHRWCSPSGPARSSPADRFPARTCCSSTTSHRTGGSGFPRSPMSTTPRASRPSTVTTRCCTPRSAGSPSAPVCR